MTHDSGITTSNLTLPPLSILIRFISVPTSRRSFIAVSPNAVSETIRAGGT